MKFRNHILVVFIIMLSLIFTACSSSNSNSGGNKTDNTEKSPADTNTTKETTNEKVTLTFMGWEASPLETASVKKGLEKFMELNPNIIVEYTPVPGAQYPTRLLTNMAGNAAPDVFFLGSTDYRSFKQRDVLLDLTPYFNLEYSLEDFIPSSAAIMNIDDEIYGVSSCTVSPVLYYNKDVFDKAGLPYPPSDSDKAWTWQEFVNTARVLTDADNNEFGFFGLEAYYMAVAELYANNVEIFNSDYSESKLSSSEAEEVFQAILDLRNLEKISPEAAVLENIGMSSSQMLQTGKVAMIANGSWALQELAQMDFPVGVGVLPSFAGTATHGQAHVHAAWAKTEHPDEAWKLISFLSSEEYQIDLISEGLWMPNRVSLYSAEGIEKWYNEDVHPEGFRDLIPYIREAHPYPYSMLYRNEINTITNDELENFWYDNQPIGEVLKNIDRQVNAILSE